MDIVFSRLAKFCPNLKRKKNRFFFHVRTKMDIRMDSPSPWIPLLDMDQLCCYQKSKAVIIIIKMFYQEFLWFEAIIFGRCHWIIHLCNIYYHTINGYRQMKRCFCCANFSNWLFTFEHIFCDPRHFFLFHTFFHIIIRWVHVLCDFPHESYVYCIFWVSWRLFIKYSIGDTTFVINS